MRFFHFWQSKKSYSLIIGFCNKRFPHSCNIYFVIEVVLYLKTNGVKFNEISVLFC